MGRNAWQRRVLLSLLAIFATVLIVGTLALSTQWIHRPFPGFFVYENLVVGPYFLPQWSADAAGLRPLDRVLEVENHPLAKRSELYDLVRKFPAGSVLRYQILRDRKYLSLAIPSMSLSLHDWCLSFGIYIVMGLAFLIIGVAPYYFRSSSPASMPLCFMVVAVFVWFETTFDFMTAGLLPKEFRIFGLILTPGTGLHLVLSLRMGKPLWRAHPVMLSLLYGVSLVLGGVISASFSAPVEEWIVFFRAGYVYTCVSALVFLVIVWLTLRGNLPDLERSRLRVMFVGAVLGFFLPSVGTVLTSSFRWDIPYNLVLIPAVFFPLSVAYALLKYSLFDLGNALKRSLSQIALTALLLGIYVTVVSLLGPAGGGDNTEPLIPLLFSILVVLLFNPLLRWIETVIERYIYRPEYDAMEVRNELSLFLRSLTTAAKLAEGFVQKVNAKVGINDVTLAYQPKETQEFVTAGRVSFGRGDGSVEECYALLSDQSLASYVHGLSRSEARTNPHLGQIRDRLLRSYDSLRSELLVPLVLDGKVRGFVSFGAKRSGREYNAEDSRLLVAVTDQLALCLENGRLYEESIKAYHIVEATNKKLIEMDKVKKQFVANICHELRTPVSTIIGFAEVLLNPSYSGDRRRMLERLVNNGQELTEVMDNLLNFSRMEAEAVFTRFEPVKLNEILQALAMMTRRLIRERPIEFCVNVEAPIDTIESDGQKLSQILMHLLTNAVKFTEKGKIELNVRRLFQGDESVLEIAVSDTGIGIELHHQEIIFEEFRQLDGSSTRHYGGTGVGLSLCRKLATSLGGNISVTSALGKGSVFFLRLPEIPSLGKMAEAA